MIASILLGILILGLLPIPTASDYILNDNTNGNGGQGLNNLINGTNNTYLGNQNTINGKQNTVNGSDNSINGSQNYVQGSNNVVGNISDAQLTLLQNQMAQQMQARFQGLFQKEPANIFLPPVSTLTHALITSNATNSTANQSLFSNQSQALKNQPLSTSNQTQSIVSSSSVLLAQSSVSQYSNSSSNISLQQSFPSTSPSASILPSPSQNTSSIESSSLQYPQSKATKIFDNSSTKSININSISNVFKDRDQLTLIFRSYGNILGVHQITDIFNLRIDMPVLLNHLCIRFHKCSNSNSITQRNLFFSSVYPSI